MTYFILVNEEKQGPFSLKEAADLITSRETMIWKIGNKDWLPASEFVEFADRVSQLPPSIKTVREEKPESVVKPAMPKTWLVESILVTLLCCLPFGIVAIIYSSKIDSLYYNGQYDEAHRASSEAGKWVKIGFCTAFACVFLYLAFIVFCVIIA